MSYIKPTKGINLIVAQKRNDLKIGERGQVYGKVMWMATSVYFFNKYGSYAQIISIYHCILFCLRNILKRLINIKSISYQRSVDNK